MDDILSENYRIDAHDNLRARKIQTQMQVLRRIALEVIVIITVAVIRNISMGKVASRNTTQQLQESASSGRICSTSATSSAFPAHTST